MLVQGEDGTANNRRETKWYYLPGPEFNNHFHIYYEWVLTANENELPMFLLYITKYSIYKKNRKAIREKSKLPYIKVVVLPDFKYGRFLLLYLRYLTWKCSTVIHARKFNIDALKDLRRRLNGRLRVLYELEGDVISEIDYLKSNRNPYASYDVILSSNDYVFNQKKIVENCDILSLVSYQFKSVIEERYAGVISEENIVVLPTGGKAFESNVLEESTRNRVRAKYCFNDKYVVNYTGNVFYTWSQFDRCIEAFILIKKHVKENAHFLAMVPENEHDIALKYINSYSLSQDEFTLIEVESCKIKEMLLASDVGLLLRPPHLSMQCGSPGKFCDYVSSGLPVLMNSYAGDYSGMVAKDNLFPVVKDLKNDVEIVECALALSKYSWEERGDILRWAEGNIVTKLFGERYVSVLDKLGAMTQCNMSSL